MGSCFGALLFSECSCECLSFVFVFTMYIRCLLIVLFCRPNMSLIVRCDRNDPGRLLSPPHLASHIVPTTWFLVPPS